MENSPPPNKSLKKMRIFLGVERKSLPDTKFAAALSESRVIKGSTSVEIKKNKKKFDQELFVSFMSKPKLPCARHCRVDDSQSQLQPSESVMANMSDRHKSNVTLKKHNSNSMRQLKTILNSEASGRLNSRSSSRVNYSEVVHVTEKEEVPPDLIEESPQKDKKANHIKNRVINLDYLDNPLSVNPTRKKEPVIKFSDIYKLLGHPRPLSNSKSHHSNTVRRSTIVQARKSFFNSLNLPTATRLAERKQHNPKLTSIVELIRNNGNHLLCRLTNSLKAYHNIEEWTLTLEGQKPQFTNILSNRLGGQFSKAQLDLISEFFFDSKGMVKPTLQLSSYHMVKVIFKPKEDEILMDVDKRQIQTLQDNMISDPTSLELIVGLYYSKHFDHDDNQLELFTPATNIFLRLLTEAKTTYYGHLSEKCSNKLQQCVDRTKELKFLAKQKDLKTFSIVRAGLDDDTVFLGGVKKGLGIDWFKGRGIDRGGDMGERITEEEKDFNRKIKDMVNNLRSILNN